MSSLTTGCQTDQSPEWTRVYLGLIQEATQLLNEDHSEHATSTLKVHPPTTYADLAFTLPSSKLRRYMIPRPPTLNVRAFWDMSACELARLVAYRNSPLGRSMLPSQQLIYDARFIYSAPQCETKASGAKVVERAIGSKLKVWDQRWWNAIWGGRELGAYLSRSWPRGRVIRGVDASDESMFTWLAELKPRDAPEIRSTLEHRLSQIPKYVGGKVIDEAAEMLYVLRESHRLLTALELRFSARLSKPEVKLCELFTRAKREYLELQAQMSSRYQALSSLSQALKPLTLIIKAPSPEMQYFITWWLGDFDAKGSSALKEVRDLSRVHAQLWGARGVLRACPTSAPPDQ